MDKKKRKLNTAEKAEKKKRREEYMTIFVRGKQKRVKRPLVIDGLDVDEFIYRNADPIWLHQNEMWEYMMDGKGLAAPHGFPDLILTFSQFLVRIRNEDTYTMAAARGSLA